MTENAIQSAIVSYCAAVLEDGWRCIAVPNASIRTNGGKAGNFCPGFARGFPDLLLIGQGRVCAMEVKTSKGTLSDFQKHNGRHGSPTPAPRHGRLSAALMMSALV